MKPRVGISRCLLGDEVRYDGGHRRQDDLLQALRPHVEWVPVCPEVEIGMGTPREPIQLVASRDGTPSAGERVRLVGVHGGEDWTARMRAWARERVAALGQSNLSGFVLKARSPSCGIQGVPIADPAGSAPRNPADVPEGRGLFAQALIDAMPWLPVEDEVRLADDRVREEFLERIRLTSLKR